MNLKTCSNGTAANSGFGNTPPPSRLVVRGEIIIFKDDFARLNAELEQRGEKTYLNPRNTAAGSLRQLAPSITARRPLKLYVYQILESSQQTPDTQSAILDYLQELGFPVNPITLARREHRTSRTNLRKPGGSPPYLAPTRCRRGRNQGV